MEQKDASEPDGDGGAVVVPAAERVSADRLGEAEPDHQSEVALTGVEAAALRILDDRRPRLDRIAQAFALCPVHLDQASPDVGVAQPDRRIDIPRERRAAGTAA